MRNFTALPIIAALLASCGGAGSDDIPRVATASAGQDGPCSTPYYSELTGIYTGTVARDGGVFDVDMEISGESRDSKCYLDFNLTTDTVPPYTDVALHGTLMTSVDIPGNESFWQSPVYPVDGWAQPRSAGQGDMTVFGSMNVNIFVVTLDGSGGLTIQDTEGQLRKEPQW